MGGDPGSQDYMALGPEFLKSKESQRQGGMGSRIVQSLESSGTSGRVCLTQIRSHIFHDLSMWIPQSECLGFLKILC